MISGTDLIHSSMRLIGAIAAGETLETNELADALVTLNQMLASWTDERLTVYAIHSNTTPLQQNVATYTMGPAAPLGARPTQIIAARCYTTSNYGRGLKLIDVNRWTQILEHDYVNLPMKAFVDYSYPLATVWLWPQAVAGTVVELYVLQEYTTFPEGAGPGPTHNFQPQRLQYALASAQSKFTIGVGGDLAAPRPARCDAIAVSDAGFRRMAEIVSAAEWATMLEPSGQPISLPIEMYVEYGYPQATLHLWPAPISAGSLEVHSLQPLPQLLNLTDNIDLPPGYEIAIRYNLAVALVPEYPRSQLDPTLVPQAQAYKTALIQLNQATQRLSGLPPSETASSPVTDTVQTAG